MTVALCDDEEEILRELSELIREEEKSCEIFTFTSANELLSAFWRFDIIFLDIQMPRLNGIEAARKLRKNGSTASIVFVTAVKEYVFDAFDVGALHYLIKPIDSEKFKEVFLRAKEECQKRILPSNEKILIRTRNGSDTLDKNDIIYAESQLKKLILHTKKKNVEYYGRLTELEKRLGDSFYRCHRGYLVNMAFIEKYDGDTITLNDGSMVYLAKSRYGDFVKNYLKYLKNGGAYFV